MKLKTFIEKITEGKYIDKDITVIENKMITIGDRDVEQFDVYLKEFTIKTKYEEIKINHEDLENIRIKTIGSQSTKYYVIDDNEVVYTILYFDETTVTIRSHSTNIFDIEVSYYDIVSISGIIGILGKEFEIDDRLTDPANLINLIRNIIRG